MSEVTFPGGSEWQSQGDRPASNAPVVILNPASGAGRAKRLWRSLERALADGRGELIVTTKRGDAERLAREAAQVGRDVVIVGGDGSIAEAAAGILAAGRQSPLGIVPAGTGNDYAYRALKLPADPLAALEIALTGSPIAIDIGTVNGRVFVNALGVGLDANINATAEHLKRSFPLLRGQALYWTASLSELLLRYSRCPQLNVYMDDAGAAGEQAHYALAALSLGPTYGGGFRINPDADPTDGFFDLCVILKPSLLRALRLLPMIEQGRHLDQPEVRRHRVRSVVLEANEPIYAHVDGEVMVAQRFEAQIYPGALLVRRPFR